MGLSGLMILPPLVLMPAVAHLQLAACHPGSPSCAGHAGRPVDGGSRRGSRCSGGLHYNTCQEITILRHQIATLLGGL